MKLGFILSFFLFSFRLQAQTLQVPEDCLAARTAPCLAHIKSFSDKPTDLGIYAVVMSADTIMKWVSFQGQASVELIKGKIQIHRLKKEKPAASHGTKKEHGKHGSTEKEQQTELVKEESLRVNGILVESSYVMVHKEGDIVKIFDLKNFMVSEYDLTDSKQPPILIKSHFVDKAGLVYFSAPFFKTKNKFLAFLKAVSKPFELKLQAQTETQTYVLKRALASVEEENKEAALKKADDEAKLKKVRELFFYRTFYR